jgi:hypothetical protein
MKTASIREVVVAAITAAGGDGLYNEDGGPCGCGIGDLNPGECMAEHCLIAKGRRVGDCDPSDVSQTVDSWGLGPDDTVWFPIHVEEKP